MPFLRLATAATVQFAAVEVEAARHGAASIGLNVFGTNDVARRLYQSAGYRVATMQMNKDLAGVAETLEPPASL